MKQADGINTNSGHIFYNHKFTYFSEYHYTTQVKLDYIQSNDIAYVLDTIKVTPTNHNPVLYTEE